MIDRLISCTSLSASWPDVFRAGTGLILLLSGLQLWHDLPVLYGAEAVIDSRLLDLYETGPTSILGLSEIGHGTLAGYLLLCLLLIAGSLARYAAVALCVLHHDIFIANAGFSYGFDFIAASAIFYCIWLPRGTDRNERTAMVLCTLQLHACIIYLFGGLEKLLGQTWRDGEALWKALHQPDLMGAWRPDISALGDYPGLVALFGWLVIILELGYPFAMWHGRLRPVWVWAIIGMHAGIALFMGLYHFSVLMILWNVTAFLLPYRKAPRITEQIAAPYPNPARRPWRRDTPTSPGPNDAPSLDPS